MSRNSCHRYSSKRCPVPLFCGSWLGSEGKLICADLILGGGGGSGRTGVPNSLLLTQYDFNTSKLSDKFHNFSTGDDPPYRLAVQPGGKGFVSSVGNDCRLFTLKKAADDDGETMIFPEPQPEVLQGVGEQNSLVFSADGTRLAAGGDDGHWRVFEWPSLKVILDQVDAHKSIKDLDFSLDAAFLASTSDDSGCRIWDLAKGTCVNSLPSVKGEGYGFARFSRDGTKPLLFVTTRKGSKGFVSAFDTSTWRQVKSKKLQEVAISAFAISRDGKLLAIGSCEGDVAIVDAATLSIQQRVRQAHMIFVTAMEFDPNGRALLTVSADYSARVTPIEPVGGHAWRGSLLKWEIIPAMMGRRSMYPPSSKKYPPCSKKYPVPLFCGAWSGSGGENEESEGTTTGGEGVVILAGGGGNGRTGVPNCLLLARYDFSTSVLSDAFHNFSTDDDPPYRLAVQPGGKGFVCSFENDCRLFTLKKAADNDGETRIFSDERQIEVLQAVGEQNSLVFSADGTRLAAGGDDGHLRVVEWPSLKVILDQVDAHKSIKDLDFSLDAAFLASTSDDSGCRIWDLAKGTCVTSLPSVKGEGYGFARFSRDGTKPLLFVTTRKGSKGFVSAFDTSTWRQVKSKKLQEVAISAFAISRDGKLLAIGSCEGDVAIVDAATLSIQQRVRQAHMIFVTAMEFDPNGQAVLTVSADYSARVTPIEPVGGDAWRGSLLLIVIFVLAMLVVIVGDGLLANTPQASSVSEFLARLKSRSLKLTPDGGV